MKNKTIYIDVTQYTQNRLNTGIQRVVNQYLKRAITGNFEIVILYINSSNHFMQLSNSEMQEFLEDVKDYKFKSFKHIDIFESKNQKIFFDIDSVWNSLYKRELLYKQLKENNFKIYNFIYDLIPILFPKLLHEKTKQNFAPYIKAIYKYSDFVFFDSNSAKNDFFKIKKEFNYKKDISSKVVYLGSDIVKPFEKPNDNYIDILSKKYILFVGTIEPRKLQPLLLDAFEELYETYHNLNLVFIGKTGWNIQKFTSYLNTHPLKDKNIFHFENIDDNNLNHFYKNAFLVTYLSIYEGYGLPIAESLNHSNITIVSKNSSTPEVGGDFVDYVTDNSKENLINIIFKYLKNKNMYKNKKNMILKGYKPISWDAFYQSMERNI